MGLEVRGALTLSLYPDEVCGDCCCYPRPSGNPTSSLQPAPELNVFTYGSQETWKIKDLSQQHTRGKHGLPARDSSRKGRQDTVGTHYAKWGHWPSSSSTWKLLRNANSGPTLYFLNWGQYFQKMPR